MVEYSAEHPWDVYIMALVAEWHPQPMPFSIATMILHRGSKNRRDVGKFKQFAERQAKYLWEADGIIGLTDAAVKEFSYMLEDTE